MARIGITIIGVGFAQVALKAPRTLATVPVDTIHTESTVLAKCIHALIGISLAVDPFKSRETLAIVAIIAVDAECVVEAWDSRAVVDRAIG